MKKTAKQQLLSKYVCLADTEERRMLIKMSAEKGGVRLNSEASLKYGHVSFDGQAICGDGLNQTRELIDTTTFCNYLLLSEEECEKVLDRRVEIKGYSNNWGSDLSLIANVGFSFIAYNDKGERIETNEPIKSIELWKN